MTDYRQTDIAANAYEQIVAGAVKGTYAPAGTYLVLRALGELIAEIRALRADLVEGVEVAA